MEISSAPVPSAEPLGELNPQNLAEGQPTCKVFKPPSDTSAAFAREYVCDSPVLPTDHVYVAVDLPDDYFQPTAADLKAVQHTLSARTQALVNAPLQLRTVREANEKAKLDRWPNVSLAWRSGLIGFISSQDYDTSEVYGSHSIGICLSFHR